MNNALKAFFTKLMEDAELREELASAKTAMEGYNKAKPYLGEEVSFDEFKEALTYVHNRVDYRKRLLNSDLRNISGGVNVLFAEVISMLSQFDGQLFE